uniref:Uncharacterized protein n=1 Tax=Eutreptiella gymnastica TaxID=73025 RepID=A0A7S4CAF9_9EUGL
MARLWLLVTALSRCHWVFKFAVSSDYFALLDFTFVVFADGSVCVSYVSQPTVFLSLVCTFAWGMTLYELEESAVRTSKCTCRLQPVQFGRAAANCKPLNGEWAAEEINAMRSKYPAQAIEWFFF